MPSRWHEPFGLVALEAMACGAALICSRRGGLPEVAGDAALYVDPDNPATIAAAIRDLANDEPRRVALSEAARTRAAQFDLAVAAPRWAALRRELIGAPGGMTAGRGLPVAAPLQATYIAPNRWSDDLWRIPRRWYR